MTLLIFNDATEPFPDAQQAAWGTALVLLALVLTLSVCARTVAWTLNRKTR
jgi:ABC-type phosphate transport system permease subunit